MSYSPYHHLGFSDQQIQTVELPLLLMQDVHLFRAAAAQAADQLVLRAEGTEGFRPPDARIVTARIFHLAAKRSPFVHNCRPFLLVISL